MTTHWNKLVPTRLPLLAACVDGEARMYLGGAMGLMLRSDDGGKTFQPLPNAPGLPTGMACDSRSERLVLACGGTGVVISRDRGATYIRSRDRSKCVHGLASLEGGPTVVTGIRGLARISQDGGESFLALGVSVKDYLGNAAVDGHGGVYLMGHALVMSSSDNGATFKSKRLRRDAYLRAGVAFADGTAVVVGDNCVMTTRNRGTNWDVQTRGLPQLHGVWGASPAALWAAGEGQVLFSSDAGTTWTLEHDEPRCQFECVAGHVNGGVVIVGNAAVLVRT